MSYEVYGLKNPHHEWEGILALDIWYQFLYKNIDAQYPFDDKKFNLNPMSRYRVKVEGGREYIDVEGQKVYVDVANPRLPDRREWAEKDSSNKPVRDEHGYVLVWNNDLWTTYNTTSGNIYSRRRECVTPREVLKKIYNIIYVQASATIPAAIHSPTGGFSNWQNLPIGTVDFDWFKQDGNVYSDHDKSMFTKYPNLHLGRAFEVMSPKDWCDFISSSGSGNERYVKPSGIDLEELMTGTNGVNLKKKMIDRGYAALVDAFSVVKNEKLLNIFNSSTNLIEEFIPSRAQHYSQSQCAIVIERIFSRIYKYLQFKSTTDEVFQRHVNVDCGFKYLTTETIQNSNNKVSGCTPYYDDNSPGEKYLMYLNKLVQYIKGSTWSQSNSILTQAEDKVLGEFVEVLKNGSSDWLSSNWDLCPLLDEVRRRSRAADDDYDETDEPVVPVPGAVFVYFNLKPYMTFTTEDVNVAEAPEGSTTTLELKGVNPERVVFNTEDPDFSFDLKDISIQHYPRYQYGGRTIEYELLGFSTTRDTATPQFLPSKVVTRSDFPSGFDSLTLYAIWRTKCILTFNAGESSSVSGQTAMESVVVDAGVPTKLPLCTFLPPATKQLNFTYIKNSKCSNVNTDAKVADLNNPARNPLNQNVNLYKFKEWTYANAGASVSVADGGNVKIIAQDDSPVVRLTARWKLGYDEIMFQVEGANYCRVLIDNSKNTLVYPAQPSLVDPKRLFLGWDKVQGTFLSGIESSTTIICGDGGGETICGDGTSPIICQEPGLSSYGDVVVARIADDDTTTFTVTFRYLGEMLKKVEKYERNVVQNTYLPDFHIHQTINYTNPENQRKKTFKFRYWKLVSGNITSSMTVMSDLVLEAVYDEIVDAPAGVTVETIESQTSPLGAELSPIGSISTLRCPYYKFKLMGEDEALLEHCSYLGMNPRKSEFAETAIPDDSDWEGIRRCPFLNLMKNVRKRSEFNVLTLVEIEDVANLLKALFKVNIDIAYKEYYLKIDVPEQTDWWYGYKDGDKWISFEPTVEFKFSNFHASNQVHDGKLLCTVKDGNAGNSPGLWITPINKELLTDASVKKKAIHYNDVWYYYDYKKSLLDVQKVNGTSYAKTNWESEIGDQTYYYSVNPLYLYANTTIQSPVDVNGKVRHKLGLSANPPIQRTTNQLKTFTSIVKKYRPIIMPNVRDIFNDCVNDKTKYQVDVDNDYGVFGWCTIPSKTMVNMEYNEQAIIVPSSYDHHNRIGGSNFLQMDRDFANIYRNVINGTLKSNVKDSWYYLYNKRDWTYFLETFFDVKPNNEVYTWQLDTFPDNALPTSSDHLNGVIFEPSTLGRAADKEFGGIADTCEFLAKYHHGENNLKILAEQYTKLLPYSKLVELTQSTSGQFNSMYGSAYSNIPSNFNYPDEDWIDDYDKTGSYVDLTIGKYKENPTSQELSKLKYTYNLGQAHAIDDFDENSVWFYITMVSPIEDMEKVVELEDIMPYVFWWENRGVDNNGPTADCYGRQSNAKLNYEKGGWCYSGAHDREETLFSRIPNGGGIEKTPTGPVAEERWHAVQHTLGTDFSKKEYGGTILTTDNSGNVYKGAFDPNCVGTNEKWKVHNVSNAFGVDQHTDPMEDKYYLGDKAHGDVEFNGKKIPQNMNAEILNSLNGRIMTWNLWNVVRHYTYIKYFKNLSKKLGDDLAAWQDLERRTKKIVKGIYRTFQEKKRSKTDGHRNTFTDVDNSTTNIGQACLVQWTNSFVEIQSMLDRNAREHAASFVLFTGDARPNATEVQNIKNRIKGEVTKPSIVSDEMAKAQYLYEQIKASTYNFRITTLDGID